VVVDETLSNILVRGKTVSSSPGCLGAALERDSDFDFERYDDQKLQETVAIPKKCG
jgi:hypothetical protein